MATCETCGNDYWMSFEVHTMAGAVHTYDCIECAAQGIAPVCEHCACRVLGHGVEAGGHFYCCAHCARMSGDGQAAELRDTVGAHPG